MVDIEDIPPKMRWEIAAKSASAIPVAYDLFFRKVVGERFDEIEMPIWTEAGLRLDGRWDGLPQPCGSRPTTPQESSRR